MDIKKVSSDLIKDSYYVTRHPSGLTIYVYPKKGYKSTYAIIGTNYGSVNTRFKVDGGDEITVPDGIAHYLEHKLFESEDGDAFARYAKTAQTPTRTPRLKRRATFSLVRSALRSRSRYSSTSCSRLTSHRRPWLRSRA